MKITYTPKEIHGYYNLWEFTNETNTCDVDLISDRYDSAVIWLNNFFCNEKNRTKGDGRSLLKNALEYIKTKHSFDTIKLGAVPKTNIKRSDPNFKTKKEDALRKLKLYYTSLGFIEKEPPNENNIFEGNIDNIIAKIKNYMGRKSKRSKKSKRSIMK